jgi:hypothetical protein
MEVVPQYLHIKDVVAPVNLNVALQIAVVLKQAKLQPNYTNVMLSTKHYVARSKLFIHRSGSIQRFQHAAEQLKYW